MLDRLPIDLVHREVFRHLDVFDRARLNVALPRAARKLACKIERRRGMVAKVLGRRDRGTPLPLALRKFVTDNKDDPTFSDHRADAQSDGFEYWSVVSVGMMTNADLDAAMDRGDVLDDASKRTTFLARCVSSNRALLDHALGSRGFDAAELKPSLATVFFSLEDAVFVMRLLELTTEELAAWRDRVATFGCFNVAEAIDDEIVERGSPSRVTCDGARASRT
jgi:hypothetical protein